MRYRAFYFVKPGGKVFWNEKPNRGIFSLYAPILLLKEKECESIGLVYRTKRNPVAQGGI